MSRRQKKTDDNLFFTITEALIWLIAGLKWGWKKQNTKFDLSVLLLMIKITQWARENLDSRIKKNHIEFYSDYIEIFFITREITSLLAQQSTVLLVF